MGRIVLTLLGLAAVGVAAVLIARSVLKPAQEQVERKQGVLTHAYQPSLVDCYVVQDAELPAGLPRPKVDEDLLYVGVVVLYPGVDRVPSPRAHRLAEVNDRPGTRLDPVHTWFEVDEEGTYLSLVYKTNLAFGHARLVRDGKELFERVELP